MQDPGSSARFLMECIGDPSRFRLVQALDAEPRCVTELAAEIGLSQSCTTRHLQALERRRVVRRTRDGKRVVYRLLRDEPDLHSLLVWALGPERTEAERASPQSGPAAGKAARRRSSRARPPIGGGGQRPLRARDLPASAETASPITGPDAPPVEATRPSGNGPRRSEIEDYLL